MMYKMINTLDSMVGYKNDTYILFGRAKGALTMGPTISRPASPS